MCYVWYSTFLFVHFNILLCLFQLILNVVWKPGQAEHDI